MSGKDILRAHGVMGSTLVLLATVTLAQGQQAPTDTTQPPPTSQGSDSTGKKPLSVPSNEGFWGHVNPFARKSWVKRQVGPVNDRLNELDGLSSQNAKDIKSIDERAQSGIGHAQDTANQASQVAANANEAATQAAAKAAEAGSRTQQLSSTVSSLDQYQTVSSTEIRFRPGQVALNVKAKDALNGIAAQMQGQKGYLVEVQGYSSTRGQSGIQSSQRLADSVVRYLVEQHEIPVYRIHVLAMGNAVLKDSSGVSHAGGIVNVTLVQNSLAALNQSGSSVGSPNGGAPQGTAVPPSAQ